MDDVLQLATINGRTDAIVAAPSSRLLRLKAIMKSTKASAAIFGKPGANARKPVRAHPSGGWWLD
jgi:hypothetical protein